MRSTSLSRSKSECNAEPAPATAGVGQEWSDAVTDQIARIERTSIPKATQVLTRLLGLCGHWPQRGAWAAMLRAAVTEITANHSQVQFQPAQNV